MNKCETLCEPDKQDSTAAKGMAILAMVFLHLFLTLAFGIIISYVIKSVLFATDKIFSHGKEKSCRL